MSKKNSDEDMEIDEDSAGSEEMEDGDDEDAPQPEMLSPSPETKKKDMHLRSGKRKRRRSITTTGLTPPDQILKKAKTTEKKKPLTENQEDSVIDNANNGSNGSGDKIHAGGDNGGDAQQTTVDAQLTMNTIPVSTVHSPQANGATIPPPNSSAPIPQQPQQLLQQPVSSAASKSFASFESPQQLSETGRKLFDATPPVPTSTTKPSPAIRPEMYSTPGHIPQVVKQTVSSPQVVVHHATSSPGINGYYQQNRFQVENAHDSTPASNMSARIFWLVMFTALYVVILPRLTDLAEWVVPLNGLQRTPNETQMLLEFERELLLGLGDEPDYDNVIVEETEIEIEVQTPEVSAAIREGLITLVELQSALKQTTQGIDTVYSGIEQILSKATQEYDSKIDIVSERSKVLESMQLVSQKALDDPDLSSLNWEEARNSQGFLIIDTTVIELWEVGDPINCSVPSLSSETDVELETPPLDPDIVTPADLEKEYSALAERLRKSAEDIQNDPDAVQNARKWIRSQIESAIDGNKAASTALMKLTAQTQKGSTSSGGISINDIQDLILERIEMERADQTGRYDHASLLNGAQVIYGGRRGTSSSLVDSLPLYNRIMQASKLRFYGYGPEASIIPTWPPDALGQCWSFQQIPIKEQLKRKRHHALADDEHKRGNFGTLTISLPRPVYVKSVIIEHPPQGLTDNARSAIRSFRVIGYADAMATEKSWSLGSFEYDIGNKKPRQEFEVATEIFRTPVPPLQSITLAIDSNWGYDYACLYRFRVHGELEEGGEEDYEYEE